MARHIAPDAKLRRIALAFRESLGKVANVAMNGQDVEKEFAAERWSRSSMPKKHVIAAAFATLCEEDRDGDKLLGPQYFWRCSMSAKRKMGLSKVKTILHAVGVRRPRSYDEWPPIQEFVHDFSASSHSIPQVTGEEECGWGLQDEFQLVFAAESEMYKAGPKKRSAFITRDLVKLCLVECPVKVVVYCGYGERDGEKKGIVVDRITQTIKRCPSPGKRNCGWLLIGLVGRWPHETQPYFHALKAGDDEAVELHL